MNLNYKATGYVIADDNGVLIGVVVNGIKQVLWKFCPDIPRRMGRGTKCIHPGTVQKKLTQAGPLQPKELRMHQASGPIRF